MTHRPIWHADGGDLVLLRCRLPLDGPCRGGRVRVAAGGPVQLYIDGVRVAGAPGGAAAEHPLWHPLTLPGSWDTGTHELVAVVGAGPRGATPSWFACEGQLDAAADDDKAHAVESGLHWQALVLPSPGQGVATERYSALEDPRHLDDAWSGVVSVPDIDITAEAPAAEERLVEASRYAACAETTVSGELSFSPGAAGPNRCKFVHRDGLLAGPAPAATVMTTGAHGIGFVLDFGRVVTGFPTLRVREGRGGLIEIGLATSWGRVEHELRYVCGSGRQEWYGLAPVRCRYAVVRLASFEEEGSIERLAMVERWVPAPDDGAELEVSVSCDRAWATGPPSLNGSRLDVYHTAPPPAPCDWLATTALLVGDAVRTGHTATGRATLEGRAPVARAPRAMDRGFPICLEAYHLYSGDGVTASRLLPAAIAAASAEGDDEQPLSAAARAVHAAGAAAAARLCRRLDREGDAERCDSLAANLREGLQRLWRPERGLFADADEGDRFHQATQGLMLLAGAAQGDQPGRIAAGLRGDDVTPVQDLVEVFALAEGLWSCGQGARALDVVRTRWLRIVEREGPTWRDKRNAEAGRAAPGPDYLLGRHLLGISPVEPGFSRRRVQPALALSRRASGRLPTPAGALGVGWRILDEEDPARTRVSLEVEGAGVTELALERGTRRNPTLSVDGEDVWRNEKIYPNPSVQEIAAETDAVVLVFDGAGSWEVTLE